MAGLIEKDGKQSTMTVDSDVFFREILARVNSGKRVKIRAKGSSMLPLVRSTKDVIFLSALTPDSIQEGRLLLVRIPRGYVLHRVEHVEGRRITLRGMGIPIRENAVLLTKSSQRRQLYSEANASSNWDQGSGGATSIFGQRTTLCVVSALPSIVVRSYAGGCKSSSNKQLDHTKPYFLPRMRMHWSLFVHSQTIE